MPGRASSGSIVSTLPHDGNRGGESDGTAPTGEGTSATYVVAGAAAAAAGALGYMRYRQRARLEGRGADTSFENVDTQLATNLAYQSALKRAQEEHAGGSLGYFGVAPLDRLFATVAHAAGLLPTAAAATMPRGNAIAVSVTEFVVLPDMTNAGIVELALPVRGELRLSTYVDQPLRACVKLAGAAPPSAGSPAGAADASFATQRSYGAASNVEGSMPRAAGGAIDVPKLGGTVLNEIVDEKRFVKSGRTELRCIPGRCETSVLLTYDTVTTDEVLPAVVARECVVTPSTASGVYNLDVTLEVSAAANDVTLELVLPKRSSLRGPVEVDRGMWGRPDGASATEFQWIAGDVPAPGDNMPSADVPKVLHSRWEYAVPPETAALVSRPNTPYFQADAQGHTPSTPSTASINQASAPWHVLLPTVNLAYTAPVAASGVRVRKLTTERLAAADGTTAVPSGDAPLKSTASYKTMYSQAVAVQPEL
eukprot:CAMPEP_0174834094 /NCGR_PEP_ID=MMETSP1114-20130205/4627_1 /TAXON_ID=312471 /ORGANISM="Neobodo designis, Strain CCAP 1951/1" /LENGTH=480 /DNA_ID=CAMNT_0016067997 /DNA_START=56 /DNA_END=1498 /DNA_ORIENTATION=-